VEKSCVAKGINRKKAKEKYFIIANKFNMRFPQTSNAWMFAMFKNFIHSFTSVEAYFLSPNRCETQISKNFQTSDRLLLP